MCSNNITDAAFILTAPPLSNDSMPLRFWLCNFPSWRQHVSELRLQVYCDTVTMGQGQSGVPRCHISWRFHLRWPQQSPVSSCCSVFTCWTCCSLARPPGGPMFKPCTALSITGLLWCSMWLCSLEQNGFQPSITDTWHIQGYTINTEENLFSRNVKMNLQKQRLLLTHRFSYIKWF